MKRKGYIKINKNQGELNVFEKRFQLMLKLYRIGQMMKKAKITFPSV